MTLVTYGLKRIREEQIFTEKENISENRTFSESIPLRYFETAFCEFCPTHSVTFPFMDSSFIKREPKEYFLLLLHVFINMVTSVMNTKRVFQRKKT